MSIPQGVCLNADLHGSKSDTTAIRLTNEWRFFLWFHISRSILNYLYFYKGAIICLMPVGYRRRLGQGAAK